MQCKIPAPNRLLRPAKSEAVNVHAIKVCGGVEVQLHAPITSALERGEW